uniref:Uncharacterized protein n=1 Tax=Rhipicephalus zambeziensis TaxID=60191 RepID=A0A224YGI9_9ACAR
MSTAPVYNIHPKDIAMHVVYRLRRASINTTRAVDVVERRLRGPTARGLLGGLNSVRTSTEPRRRTHTSLERTPHEHRTNTNAQTHFKVSAFHDAPHCTTGVGVDRNSRQGRGLAGRGGDHEKQSGIITSRRDHRHGWLGAIDCSSEKENIHRRAPPQQPPHHHHCRSSGRSMRRLRER